MMADAEKPKKGRPKGADEFRPEYVDQARKLCILGATDADVADFFGVSERTINRWKSTHDDFCQSLKAGKGEADDRVERSLYHRAVGYSHEAVKIVADAKSGEVLQVPYREHYPPDTTAAIFWLKNRKPADWRDKTESHTTLSADSSIAGLMQRINANGGKIYDKG